MKINVLKAVAGRTWGKGKETLIKTYKAIGRSNLNYAAPVWSPQLIRRQTLQQQAQTQTLSHSNSIRIV